MTEKQWNLRSMGMEASYLAGCALHDTTAQLNDNVDLLELYRFCKFHSITSIVAMALDTVWKENPADEEVMKKWRQSRDKAIRKNILLNAERERILAHLESIGCWYMPLKGSLLQFEYPQFGMRQMSDNDILFDETRARDVYDFMIACGYEALTFDQGKDDEYVKKPLYNIEMHRALFGTALYPELAEAYRNVKSRLVKDPNNGFGYHFTDEDFYIYMVTHAYKHYIHGGIGIRNLMDVYVYVQNHGSAMNWDYTHKELQKVGAGDFEAECRALGTKLFSSPARDLSLEENEKQILDVYFSSGTFGTQQQAVEKRLESVAGGKNGGKLRYIISRLFPSMEYMKERDPILRRKPWLAPWFYIRRLFLVAFGRRKFILRELDNLKQAKK